SSTQRILRTSRQHGACPAASASKPRRRTRRGRAMRSLRRQSPVAWSCLLALVLAGLGGAIVYTYHAGRASSRSEAALRPPDVSAPAASLTMDEGQRAYLWEIEHHGLLLSRHGFRRLAEALRRADHEALR